MDLLLALAISAVFSAGCLWIAMKLTGVDGTVVASLLLAGMLTDVLA